MTLHLAISTARGDVETMLAEKSIGSRLALLYSLYLIRWSRYAGHESVHTKPEVVAARLGIVAKNVLQTLIDQPD